MNKLINKINNYLNKYEKNYKILKNKHLDNSNTINFVKNKTSINKYHLEKNISIDEFKGHLNYLSIGKNTYAGSIYIYGYKGNLEIGKFCSIAEKLILIIGDGFHDYKLLSTYPFYFKKPFKEPFKQNKIDINNLKENFITIGNDVWIGTEVTIIKNIKIGNGAVIAAKAVVTENVPPFAIIAGNPAKIIGYRYKDKEIIDLIIKIKWWDWSDKKIIDNKIIFNLKEQELKKELIKLVN